MTPVITPGVIFICLTVFDSSVSIYITTEKRKNHVPLSR
ncbi:hypothetical protein [Nostoc phage YongM]|nr:hypothetical protein [Nostoc phage YongM]